MRTIAVLAILALVASASCFTAFKKCNQKGTNCGPKMDYATIEATKAKVTYTFGDLLNLFQTHDFQVNDQLVAFLDGLTAQIQQEHNDHLALYTEQRAALEEEFEFRESEIAAAQDSLARSQAQLQLASSEEQRAENLGDLASQALVIYNQQLQSLRDARADQIARFNERISLLQGGEVAIAETINILDELELESQKVVPVSFVQKVNSLLAVTVRSGHSHKVLPIYNALLQAQTSQWDVSDLQDLRDRLNGLLANLQNGEITVNDQEAADAAAFADQEAQLLAVIQKLTDQVNASVEYAARMHASVEQEESISLQAQGKIDRNTDLLAQAHALSDDCDAEFQQGEDTRRSQLEFLSQIRNAVQALEVQFGQSLLPNIGDLVSLDL